MIIKNKILILSLLFGNLVAIHFAGINVGGANGWFYNMSVYSGSVTLLLVLLLFILKIRALYFFIVGFLVIQFIGSIFIVGMLYSEIDAKLEPSSMIALVLLMLLRVVTIYLLATCIVPQSSSTTK
jgi:hypothetical protein